VADLFGKGLSASSLLTLKVALLPEEFGTLFCKNAVFWWLFDIIISYDENSWLEIG
jgi:hypothetical protein